MNYYLFAMARISARGSVRFGGMEGAIDRIEGGTPPLLPERRLHELPAADTDKAIVLHQSPASNLRCACGQQARPRRPVQQGGEGLRRVSWMPYDGA